MRAPALLQEYDLKAWEKALVVLSILLFLSSLCLYVSDFPLRRYLFNIEDVGTHRQVGIVFLKNGVLRRQLSGEAEFKSTDLQSPLYDEDTVVTGPEGGATLQLEDGSTIELAANTMVRLRFETTLSLGGISRAANVDVVAGDVTGESKQSKIVIRSRDQIINMGKASRQTVTMPRLTPVRVAVVPKSVEIPIPKPTPSPAPFVDPIAISNLELISPKSGTQVSLDKNTHFFEKTVSAVWKVSPPDRRVLVRLSQITGGTPGEAIRRKEIYQDLIAAVNGQGKVSYPLKAPGTYEWQIKDSKGEAIPGAKITHAFFQLEREFEGIEILDPLVGGQVMLSNRLQGRQLKSFDITLRWRPLPQIGTYRIAVKAQPTDKKPVLERIVKQPQYAFNKNRVYNGQIFYQVYAPLKNGFVARSPSSTFSFSFLAPAPVLPGNHSQLTQAQLATEGNGVLLTWQKTNFTDYYELEVSRNAQFKGPVQRQKLKENFYLFKAPQPGQYYWRIRGSSISSGGTKVLSAPSDAFDFTVMR